MDMFEFLGQNPMLTGILVVLIILFISNEFAIWTRKFKVAAPKLAVELMNQQGATVLDIRNATEFKTGHIVDAKSVPLSSLEGSLKSLENLKSAPIIVCCAMGQHSARAATTLAKAGFQKVYMLKGGVGAWQQENYPLSRKGK